MCGVACDMAFASTEIVPYVVAALCRKLNSPKVESLVPMRHLPSLRNIQLRLLSRGKCFVRLFLEAILYFPMTMVLGRHAL
jgi:hypothetical protein